MENPITKWKGYEKTGKVSVWGALFSSEDELEKYLEENYPDEGLMFSNFSIESGMITYDHAFMDAVFHESRSQSPEDFFRGVSFSISILKGIHENGMKEDFSRFNTVICLFNFEFRVDEDFKKFINNPNVEFIGVFDFDKESDEIV